MIFIKPDDNYALVSRRFLWREHTLFLRDMDTGIWFRDKLLSNGVKCIGKNESLDKELVMALSDTMLQLKMDDLERQSHAEYHKQNVIKQLT